MKCRYTLFLLLAMGLLCTILPGELISQEKEKEKTLAEEWTDVDLPMGEGYIEDLVFTDENNGWAVGIDHTDNMAQILRTTDGGAIWTVNSEPGMGSINFIYFVDGNQAYAGGQNYNNGNIWILKSTNGGDTWTDENLPEIPGNLNAMDVYGNELVVIGTKYDGGQKPVILRKAGTSWALANVPDIGAWLKDVHFSGNDGWAVGGIIDGTLPLILHTNDGGKNWGTVDNIPFAEGMIMTVTSQYGTLYFGGADSDGPIVMLSTDAGANWAVEDVPQDGIFDSGNDKKDIVLGAFNIKIAAMDFYDRMYMLMVLYVGDIPTFVAIARDQDGSYRTVGIKPEGEPGGAIVTVGQGGGGGGGKKPEIKIPVKKKNKNKITTITDDPPDEMKYLELSVTPGKAMGDGCFTKGSGFYEYMSIAPATAVEMKHFGWNFTHWSGDVSGTAESTTVTMDSDKSGTAHFKQVKLNINSDDDEMAYYNCLDFIGELEMAKFFLEANENDWWKIYQVKFDIDTDIDFDESLIVAELYIGEQKFESRAEKFVDGVLTFSTFGIQISPNDKIKCKMILIFDTEKIKLDKEKPSRKLDVTLEPNGIVAETVVYENKLIEGGSGNELMVARIYTDNKSQEKEYFVEFADVYYNLSTFEYTNIELCPGEYDNIPTIKNTPGLEIRNLGDFDNPVLVDNLVFDFGEKGFISDLRLKNITFDIDNAKAAVNIENRIHNVWIENCIFRSEDGIGISNNKLRQYYEGALYSNIHIANNKFHNHRIAILLQDYYKVYINDNEFLDYKYGIFIENNSVDIKISKNNFYKCNAEVTGAAIYLNEYDLKYATKLSQNKGTYEKIKINNNVFNLGYQGEYDIQKEVSGIKIGTRGEIISIDKNIFWNCNFGIIVDNGSTNQIRNNTFSLNKIGLYFKKVGLVALIHGNDFNENRIAGILCKDTDLNKIITDFLLKGNTIERNGSELKKGIISEKNNNIVLEDPTLYYGGIVLDNASAKMSRNRIHSDSTAGVILINESKCDIRNSSFSGNHDYAIDAEDGSEADARYNWWGDASGPSGEGPGSGDAVSANVIYTDFLDKELGAVSFFSRDTLFVPVGTADSLDLMYRNFIVDDDSFDITLTESQDWITSAKSFNTGNLDTSCHISQVHFITPDQAPDDIVNQIINKAVSNANNSDTDQDTTYILCYEPYLDKLLTVDTTFVIQGDTAWVAVWGEDQYSNPHEVGPTWSVSGGGTIDQEGMFASDGTIGTFEVTAKQGDMEANGFIKVLDSTVSVYEYELSPDFITLQPNPVKELTVLEIRKQVRQDISLMVVDLHGNRVDLHVQEQVSNNTRRYSINTSSLSSGVYFIKIIMDGRRYSVKMIKAN